jgi:hypothetical protein
MSVLALDMFGLGEVHDLRPLRCPQPFDGGIERDGELAADGISANYEQDAIAGAFGSHAGP